MKEKKVKLMLGDNISSLKKLPDNSIDSVVTDPPYGLLFMGKKWDYDVPSVDFWKEVYRVLKPGGHVLSFGGTRTYHRMVVNIEDAGFEIRDQIMWLYGSGFPKSHNIGKAVDKLQGNEREVIGEKTNKINLNATKEGDKSFYENAWQDKNYINIDITKGTSPYEGWGTALKPANEPICVARKPLSEKSVAENVLKWGTGGINVDGCRVSFNGDKPKECELVDFRGDGSQMNLNASGKERKTIEDRNYIPNEEGRFPANIILECICDEVIKGEKGEVKKTTRDRKYDIGDSRWDGLTSKQEGIGNYNDKGDIHTNPNCPCYLLDEQSGSASRFFYQAKVSKKERNMGLDGFEDKVIEGRDVGQDERSVAYKKRPTPTKNVHPTVKPVALMVYLCRLVTPPNGIVLDPFMGSGSTGIAARLEGFRFVGMEMDEDYFKIAEARINDFESYREFIKK